MAGRLVVGVDGSPGSDRALRWALDEAHQRQSHLDILHLWQTPAVTEVTGLVMVELSERLEKGANAVLQSTLERVVGPEPGVGISAWVAEGPPYGGLIDAADGADLLVVGSRGRGTFKSLLLGSVSQACVHHAPCPVVVVRPPSDQWEE